LVIIGLEVLTAVAMKNSVFWDITPCSLSKANKTFREMCRLHLQSQRVSQAEKKEEEEEERKKEKKATWSRQQPKYWLNFSGLHGVITQKIEL
jgi:hypothetical protein